VSRLLGLSRLLGHFPFEPVAPVGAEVDVTLAGIVGAGVGVVLVPSDGT